MIVQHPVTQHSPRLDCPAVRDSRTPLFRGRLLLRNDERLRA